MIYNECREKQATTSPGSKARKPGGVSIHRQNKMFSRNLSVPDFEEDFCQCTQISDAYGDEIRVRLAKNRPQKQVHERLREDIKSERNYFTMSSTTSSKSQKMTEGNITRLLVMFALPLFVGNLFQQFYNTVDSIVVGNFVSKTALAAVGSTDCIINTIIGFFTGLSTGAGVVIAHSFGAGNNRSLHRAVHTTIALTIVLSVIFTIAGLVLSPVFLQLMDTPDDVLPEASQYLRIYFAGVSGLML